MLQEEGGRCIPGTLHEERKKKEWVTGRAATYASVNALYFFRDLVEPLDDRVGVDIA